MMNKKDNVLIRIVDDDYDLLNAISFLLEAEGWKVKKYQGAKEFLLKDSSSTPGCLLLDVKMPEMTGLELQQEMNLRGLKLPIIFLSAHGNIGMAVHTLHEGAVDFLEKPVDEDKLLSAISKAVKLDALKRGTLREPEEIKEKISQLTEREVQITKLLAQGLLNREIAERLGISIRTVETHRLRIFKKIAVNNISELIQLLQLYHSV